LCISGQNCRHRWRVALVGIRLQARNLVTKQHRESAQYRYCNKKDGSQNKEQVNGREIFII
jgi:hypothetical protein